MNQSQHSIIAPLLNQAQPVQAVTTVHPDRPCRYDAFISYSQKADARLARALEYELKRFAKPWFRLRAANVFRDETSLSATPGLWPEITARMDECAYLIVLGSPAAAASKWVAREICHWISGGSCSEPGELTDDQVDPDRLKRLLLVVTDGVIAWDDETGDFDWRSTTALPRKVLEGKFREEPLWVDLTWVRDQPQQELDRTHQDFMHAVARLAAPIRNLDIEVLIGRDYREHRMTMRLFRALTLGLLLFLGISLSASWFAYGQWNDAEERLGAAHFQSGRRALISDRDPGAGVRWLAESLQTTGAKSADMRQSSRRLIGGWAESLPDFSLVHDGPVVNGAWSPDGTKVATATATTVQFWDAATGDPIGQPMVHRGELSTIAFSPDSRTLATSASEAFEHTGTAYLWNTASGDMRADLSKEGLSEIYMLVFSPDGRMVATAGPDGVLRFDSTTGRRIGDPLKQRDETFLVAFSPDGSTLATGSRGVRGEDDGDVCIWDAASGALRGKPVEHDQYLEHFVFSPDGSVCAATHDSGVVRLWDAKTGELDRRPIEFGESISLLSFSPDGATLAARCTDTIRFWNLKTHSEERRQCRLPSHVEIDEIEFSPDGESVILSGPDGSICRSLTDLDIGPVPLHRTDRGMRLARSPDRRRILTAGNDRVARAWNNASHSAGASVMTHPDNVEVLAYSPDGKTIAGGDWRGHVVSSDARTQKERWRQTHDTSTIKALDFTTDGQSLYVADDSTLFRLDPASGTVQDRLPFGSTYFQDALIHADRGLAATVEMDVPQGGFEPPEWNLHIWKMGEADSKVLQHMRDHKINDLAFTKDGTRLAVAWEDRKVRVSEVDSANSQPVVLLHPGPVSAVAFHPGGSMLAAAADNSVLLWDLASQQEIGDRMALGAGAAQLLFSPDGRFLLVVSEARAQLWDVATRTPLSEPLQHPCGVRQVAYRPDGLEIALAGENLIWQTKPSTPIPESVSARRVILSVEVRTALTIRDGVIRTLTEADLAERKQELAGLGGDCLP